MKVGLHGCLRRLPLRDGFDFGLVAGQGPHEHVLDDAPVPGGVMHGLDEGVAVEAVHHVSPPVQSVQVYLFRWSEHKVSFSHDYRDLERIAAVKNMIVSMRQRTAYTPQVVARLGLFAR
jgi:hypothetical protein